MQWYDHTVEKLEPDRQYSHQALISELRQDNPELRESSFHWAISGMLRSGSIVKTGYNEYRIPDGREKKEYNPFYSDVSSVLLKQVSEKYPLVSFTVFETALMNDFLNHLVAQNTVFLQVEKEYSIFVFRYLQDLGYTGLMYKPSKADFSLYWKADCIVVTDLISEAPVRESSPHEICLEKLLVDMYCDKLILSTYSQAEYPEVLREAMNKWLVEKPKLLRYARRRGKGEEISRILEEISNAEA